MPELPEVEVLRRHLERPLLGRVITELRIVRKKVLHPTSSASLSRAVNGTTIRAVNRRGKYLVFHLWRNGRERLLLGHLGMTGRMFVQAGDRPLPPHTAVHFRLGADRFIYQDTRYFGRFTLDLASLAQLGPEPWSDDFRGDTFRASLGRSRQAIKVKLLDQSLVAGVGNIYASEALHRAGISPRRAARRLTLRECSRLVDVIREVLAEAIENGSTMPLDFGGESGGDGLFYYGKITDADDSPGERLLVYDREGLPCHGCGGPVKRLVQAARSTFFCPGCQR